MVLVPTVYDREIFRDRAIPIEKYLGAERVPVLRVKRRLHIMLHMPKAQATVRLGGFFIFRDHRRQVMDDKQGFIVGGWAVRVFFRGTRHGETSTVKGCNQFGRFSSPTVFRRAIRTVVTPE